MIKMKEMKVYINKISVLALSLVLGIATSCSKDFLDTTPSNSLPTEDVFKSIVTAESALIGNYDIFSAYVLDGMWTTLMSDIVGEDIMINSVDNWNWFVPVYQLEVLPNYQYVEDPWSAGYKAIFDANNIIENAQSIPDATQEEKDNLEGQSRVIRAFTMLRLAQMYAPSYSSGSDQLSILNANKLVSVNDEDFPRATNDEVYKQIVSDLLSAIDLLEEGNDKGFFDRRSARAVLARTYLDMHEWEKARDMAKLAHEGLELMNINDMFAGFFSRNSETIFTVAYTPEDNNIYMSLPSFYWPVYGYSSMRANDDFVSVFSTSDARKSFFLMEEEIDADRNLILKFAHNNSVGNAEKISIRASEMYLIESECEAELGNYPNAQEALYLIQSRSIPGVSKSTKVGQDLIDEILLERRKELFGEGFRWNDIKRRSLPFVRTGDHWVDFNFGPTDNDYYRLTFPLPQSEIDANSKISQSEQNVGY